MDSSNQNESNLPRQIERLIQALSGVRSLTDVEIKDHPEHALYQHILDAALKYTDADCCSIFLNHDGVLKCAAGRSWDEVNVSSVLRISTSYNTFTIGQGIIGKCAEQETVVHCHDCKQDPDFISVAIKNGHRIGSVISAPLISCGQLLGVINISHPHANHFESWHERVIATYANIIAQVLHNHRLIQSMDLEIHKQTKELKLALKEANELRKRYQELSFIDYLTEIHNRRYFFPEFASAIANAQRHGHTISLLVLDLDLFKSVNDNYGHELGDAVLIGVSQLLKRQVRKGDLLARLGGEEFAIALIGTNIHEAMEFGDRLRLLVQDLKWSYQNQEIQISMSVGVSSLEHLKSEPEEAVRILMSEADMALYSCKRSGRNTIKSYNDLETSESSRNIS